MFKVDFLSLERLITDSCGSKAWPSQISALLLSLIAHVFLILLIDSQIGLIPQTRPSEPNSNHAINIHVVSPEKNSIALATKSSTSDIQTEMTEKPREFMPSPSEARQDIPPPIFEILAPPTPHYFRSNVLSIKPQVSSDIPQDLANSLTSDIPGLAIFRLQINEQGEVDQVIVDESSFSESDQHIVVDAFRKMKFEPGRIDNNPVKSELRIEVMMEKTAPALYPELEESLQKLQSVTK